MDTHAQAIIGFQSAINGYYDQIHAVTGQMKSVEMLRYIHQEEMDFLEGEIETTKVLIS